MLNSDVKEFAEIKKICQKNQLQIIDYGFEAQALKLIKIENQKVDFYIMINNFHSSPTSMEIFRFLIFYVHLETYWQNIV